ncbi:MAG: ATP synthase F1 subunit gamma [Phycisphaerales bacterium]|nr:MAG: ATP synthase F1 subunit gamma [Phycisphaerales bacterium]
MFHDQLQPPCRPRGFPPPRPDAPRPRARRRDQPELRLPDGLPRRTHGRARRRPPRRAHPPPSAGSRRERPLQRPAGRPTRSRRPAHAHPRQPRLARALRRPPALPDRPGAGLPSRPMGKSREIKLRMKAVGNIKRITRTMQMIATAKFSAAQGRAVNARPYNEALFGLVNELAAGGGLSHPLLEEGADGARELTLVISSDRGLCGPYNGNIVKTALRVFREEQTARAGDVEVVGKKGLNTFKFNAIPVSAHHVIGDTPRYEDVERLAQRYIERFTSGEVRRVRVIYMKFISAGQQRPEILQLLPLTPPPAKDKGDAEQSSGAGVEYELSPKGPELLAELLPAAIKSLLFQAFNDAVVSEHVARMIAMKAATDNAGKMGKALSREYNRARQAQITTELTEIISGAAALE